MDKESLLRLVDSLHRDKEIAKDVVFQCIEAALTTAARKHFKSQEVVSRSRAFVNDAAVALSTLEEIGRELVDIHGQHQHQSLLRVETHLDFLGGFAGLAATRAAYGGAWARLEALAREREALARGEQEKERRLEFLRFQQEEQARAGSPQGAAAQR